MTEIPISYLYPGQINEQPYFSEHGKILIPQGTVLTIQDISSLKKKGINRLFIQDTSEQPDTFHIINKPGKEGYIELQKSPKCEDLDSHFAEFSNASLPSGPAFKNDIAVENTLHRSVEYINSRLSDYDNALQKIKDLLQSLVQGKKVSAESIRSISTHFAESFLSDPHFMINLSNLKSDSGDYLFHHSLNVCILAINIAAASGCNQLQVVEIGMGALLHDIGMLLIPQEIRLKSSRPTEDEWYEIQKHPLTGIYLLERISRLPEPVILMTYQSHERENGKGYPKQRSSSLIDNYAKILSVADIFEALSSPRSYRDAYLPYKAIETLITMTRQGLVNGEYVKALLEYTSLFPIGSIVELSNKSIGRVVKSNGTSFAKPSVCILIDNKGNILEKDEQYIEDLSSNTSVQIVKAHQTSQFSQNIMLGF